MNKLDGTKLTFEQIMTGKTKPVRVLITGILGQDGANMAEYLLANTDVFVYGLMRQSSNPNLENIKNIINLRFKLIIGDLTDSNSIENIVKDIQPDYFINFAGNSFVKTSWEMPEQVFNVNTLGVIRCLEAIKRFKPTCRFYSAGSSEEFGDVDYSPQDIKHPIKPRSPYGASKAAARHIVKSYRDSYSLYALHGILFNHEGTKRGKDFVTRKITKGVARIYKALATNGQAFEPIELGNLDAKRDWSDSEDFVDGVWRILNQEVYNTELKGSFRQGRILIPGAEPEPIYSSLVPKLKEYVLASGESHSIREFIEEAFKAASIEFVNVNPTHTAPLVGLGKQINYTTKLGEPLVTISSEHYRPAEVELLMGDSEPIRKELGWRPKTNFINLVKKMVWNDILKNYNDFL